MSYCITCFGINALQKQQGREEGRMGGRQKRSRGRRIKKETESINAILCICMTGGTLDTEKEAVFSRSSKAILCDCLKVKICVHLYPPIFFFFFQNSNPTSSPNFPTGPGPFRDGNSSSKHSDLDFGPGWVTCSQSYVLDPQFPHLENGKIQSTYQLCCHREH